MAISFVQKAVAATQQKSADKTLIEVLVKNMGKYYPQRSHKVVHASDVTKDDFCVRKFRLMDTIENHEPHEQWIPAALRATFDMGHAAAELFAEKWLGTAAVGNWRCRNCGNTRYFQIKPEKGCPHCDGTDLMYQEVGFYGKDHHVSGSLDVLVDLGRPKLTVVEIKIINTTDFDKIVAPLAEHRLRTRLYLKLVESSDNPFRFKVDVERAKIIYISRGFGKMNAEAGQILPFKEFDIERDDESISEYLARGLDVHTHRQNGTIPVHKVCATALCTTAKGCPVKKACWSGTIP